MMHRRIAATVAGLLSVVGCSPATFDVSIHEQLPVDQISATALARGAEVRWTLPELVDGAEAEPLLLVFLPVEGDADVLVVPATSETVTTNALVVGVDYVVQLTT